jgi:hypothetical protein
MTMPGREKRQNTETIAPRCDEAKDNPASHRFVTAVDGTFGDLHAPAAASIE